MARYRKKEIVDGHMVPPTFVVGRKDFNLLAYARAEKFIVHGRRGLELVPDKAQEIGENQVMFPEGPKKIIFRRRFSRKTVTRDVRYITADNSRRYDLQFTISLKP